ncbi:CdaR family protein [Ligilactobacillus sp. LYQ135]
MKFNNIFNSKFMYALTSLLFALFLFGYVTTDTGSNANNTNKNGLMSQKTATITAPLKINVSSKYFVEGYPQNVQVKINGPAAMVQTTENTQNFQVYADLTGLKPGKHTVKLQTSGINRELTANVEPKTITVKISKRKSKSFPVQVRFDSTLIGNGYAAGIPTSSYKKVTVTGAKSTVNKVTNVVADVSLPEGVEHSVSQNVTLQALDSNGKPLNVAIQPVSVKATVPIYAATTSKKVSVHLVESGTGDSSKNYSLSTDTKTVTVTGTKQALSRLDSLNVAVPINDVTSDTTKTVPIDTIQNGIIAVSPSSITVQITVSNKSESSNETSSSIAETEESSYSSSQFSSQKSSSAVQSSTSQQSSSNNQ